jgi:hypothetical protein
VRRSLRTDGHGPFSEDDFYESDARYTAADIKEMGDLASAQFRRNHLEVSEEAIEALAWCYTYDYK